VTTPATANGGAPRGKIAVLVSGQWLYGTVNRGEFSRAVGTNEKHQTFKLSKRGWRAGSSSVITVAGSHVAAWEWTPTGVSTRAKRKVAKPMRVPMRDPVEDIIMQDLSAVTLLTDEQRADAAAATHDLDRGVVSLLCIAAGVPSGSIDDLTQVTWPPFQEALAAHMAAAEVG
jgi:hypothetical protein